MRWRRKSGKVSGFNHVLCATLSWFFKLKIWNNNEKNLLSAVTIEWSAVCVCACVWLWGREHVGVSEVETLKLTSQKQHNCRHRPTQCLRDRMRFVLMRSRQAFRTSRERQSSSPSPSPTPLCPPGFTKGRATQFKSVSAAHRRKFGWRGKCLKLLWRNNRKSTHRPHRPRNPTNQTLLNQQLSSGLLKSVAPAPTRASRQRGGDGAGSVRSGAAAPVRIELPGKMSEEEVVPNRGASLTFTIEHILSLKQRGASTAGCRGGVKAQGGDNWDVRTGFDSGVEPTGGTTGESDQSFYWYNLFLPPTNQISGRMTTNAVVLKRNFSDISAPV